MLFALPYGLLDYVILQTTPKLKRVSLNLAMHSLFEVMFSSAQEIVEEYQPVQLMKMMSMKL